MKHKKGDHSIPIRTRNEITVQRPLTHTYKLLERLFEGLAPAQMERRKEILKTVCKVVKIVTERNLIVISESQNIGVEVKTSKDKLVVRDDNFEILQFYIAVCEQNREVLKKEWVKILAKKENLELADKVKTIIARDYCIHAQEHDYLAQEIRDFFKGLGRHVNFATVLDPNEIKKEASGTNPQLLFFGVNDELVPLRTDGFRDRLQFMGFF